MDLQDFWRIKYLFLFISSVIPDPCKESFETLCMGHVTNIFFLFRGLTAY